MDGVGLRLYRRSGPLLDTVISVSSVALFGLLKVDASGVTDGGLALQLADIAISPASAASGNNGVAQGILGDAKQSGGGGDPTPLKPTFSPELALQKRQGDPDVAWSLTAGPGDGPWLLPINRSFGPLRIDDVGFGDEVVSGKVTSIRIIISGGLSLAGLNLDVQELSVGAATAVRSPTPRPGAWTWPGSRSPTPAAASSSPEDCAAATIRPCPAIRRTTSASCWPASDLTGCPPSAATASSPPPTASSPRCSCSRRSARRSAARRHSS
jgi:hypothetical protein